MERTLQLRDNQIGQASEIAADRKSALLEMNNRLKEQEQFSKSEESNLNQAEIMLGHAEREAQKALEAFAKSREGHSALRDEIQSTQNELLKVTAELRF